MTEFLTDLEELANETLTENGALTYVSSGNYCLDLFACVGALRHRKTSEVIDIFEKAYAEHKDLAMRILFYARDVRQGLGERNTFKRIIRYLASAHTQSVVKNLKFFAEYGRFDDMLVLLDTPCENAVLDYIKIQFEKDLAALDQGAPVSLLGKWLPSINASNANTIYNAQKVAKYLGLDYKTYRKSLAALRKSIDIIENKLREMDYSSIDYEKQTSRSLFKYKNAFWTNDEDRYSAFLDTVEKGEVQLKTSSLMPYELVNSARKAFVSDNECRTLNATWQSLPDYCDDSNTLAVVDTSGSMYWSTNPAPIDVAMSLGLYFAERNKGAFKDMFIEFSRKPVLINIKGDTFVDRIKYMFTFEQCANTDIQAVFDLILNAALKSKCGQEELPSRILLISDMEFDEAVSGKTNFEEAKQKFNAAGYELPQVVFWNVEARHTQVPVRQNEKGAVLVSGFSQNIFNQVLQGETSPLKYMLDVINSDRYKDIVA